VSWLLIDLLLVVFALVVIGLAGYAGWTHVRSLLRAGKDASARVGAATAALDAVQK
jgi:hypothetical protein